MTVPKVFVVNSWETPATHYPRGKFGKVEIKTTFYARSFYHAYMTGPGGERYEYYQATKRFGVTALKINRKVWMVDDPPHFWAMQEHARQYQGHVLVAGLGLGLIVHELDKNPKVKKITVIEREPDVIAAIGPLVPSGKLQIIEADWFEYRAAEQPDGVFYDLFVGDGRELLPEAIGTYVRMVHEFPSADPIRIHGFNNDEFARLRGQIPLPV